MPLSLCRNKLRFRYWVKAKNITPKKPINALAPKPNKIGHSLKRPEGVGDSFITIMTQLAEPCGTDQIPLSVDISFQCSWSLPKPNVSLKLREEVLKTEYPPFRNVIFRAASNELYNNFVHIYTNGSKDPITGKTGMVFYVEPLPQ